jgi:hypothetical protein
MADFAGGCACGAVRYACSGQVKLALNCHCRDCQHASGSAFVSGLIVANDTLAFTKGEARYYRVIADSGTTTTRGFCGTCGSPLIVRTAASPHTVAIAAGSLDDPSWHRPTVDIWVESAQPWDRLNPALQQFPKGYQRPCAKQRDNAGQGNETKERTVSQHTRQRNRE